MGIQPNEDATDILSKEDLTSVSIDDIASNIIGMDRSANNPKMSLAKSTSDLLKVSNTPVTTLPTKEGNANIPKISSKTSDDLQVLIQETSPDNLTINSEINAEENIDLSLIDGDDDPIFDGDDTPTLETDSEDDSYVISEDKANVNKPGQQIISSEKDEFIPTETRKANKPITSMPVLDLGLDMPSLLEPERIERSKKKPKEQELDISRQGEDEFDKLFQTLKKPEDRKPTLPVRNNDDIEGKKDSASSIIQSSSKDKDYNTISYHKTTAIDEGKTTDNELTEQSINTDLETDSLSTSLDKEDTDESSLDSTESTDDLKNSEKSLTARNKEFGSEIESVGSKDEKSDSVLKLGRDGKERQRQNSRKSESELAKEEEKRKLETLKPLLSPNAKEKTIDHKLHDKEKLDKDGLSLFKKDTEESLSDISKLKGSRVVDANIPINAESEHVSRQKKRLSITKDDSGEKILDSKKMEDGHNAERSSEGKETNPIKKKVKSFASAMSLFLKSKKDTSYVENPVKGKKTVKKFKKRRGPKKFNQPAKSPNPNNSETKR